MTPERTAKLNAVLDKRQPDITLVMENVHDPHNIAAVMRSCDATGLQEIYIINTELPARKNWGTRSSSSANKWLRVHTFEDVSSCFDAIRKRYDVIFTTRLQPGATDLYAMDFTASVALVFGNEKKGVSEEAGRLADGNFVIPQSGMISSLNISVACAVTLYEAYRQKALAGHFDRPRLDAESRAALRRQWKMYDSA